MKTYLADDLHAEFDEGLLILRRLDSEGDIEGTILLDQSHWYRLLDFVARATDAPKS